MPPPPPPPGAPPPPPAFGSPPPPIGNFKPAKGGANDRSALLSSIQKGKQLKKTVTVDKSGPMIAGRVSDGNSRNTNKINSSANARPSMPSSNIGSSSAGSMKPKLSGIFEGLSEMPKLKSVGNKSKPIASSNNESFQSAGNSVQTTSARNFNAMPQMDFNAELSNRVMKKQMIHQQGSIPSNRPLPQPPIQNITNNTTLTSNYLPMTIKNPVNRFQNSGAHMDVSSNGSMTLPSKFKIKDNENERNLSSAIPPGLGTLPNPRKPSFAPKPINAKLTAFNTLNHGNSMPDIGDNNRRMNAIPPQKMNKPRMQQFGTLHGPPQSKPILQPPKPSHQAPLPPTQPNITPMREQQQQQMISNGLQSMSMNRNMNQNVASPLQHQRTAPPKPLSRELPPIPTNNFNNGPPPIPSIPPPIPSIPPPTQRVNYSANVIKQPPPPLPSTKPPNPTRNHLVIDINGRLGHLFHDVADFPPPMQYTNCVKNYPTQRNVVNH